MSFLWYIWRINKFISLNSVNFVREYHLEKIVWIVADLPIFFVPTFLVAAWIYYTIKWNIEKKKDLIFMFFSIVWAIITNLIIQHLVIENRPETFIQPILDHIPDASFPSDHAAVSFAFLTSLYLFWYKKTFWIYLPFVVLMNWARIAWWVHWFFDVIVWAIIGIFWAVLFKKLRKNNVLNKVADFFIKVAKFFKL